MPEPILHTYSDVNDFAGESAEVIENFIKQELRDKKIVRVALSGGKSPVAVYRKLSENKKIPWSRVTIFMVDERYVPLNSKDSNYLMINENLAEQVSNLRRFYHYNTRDQISIIVDQYEKMLKAQDGSPLFDLVILGMGADGHTASLFPGDSTLHEKNRLVMNTQKPDQNFQERMTLTFPAILDSKKIIFLISGKDKQRKVDELINGNQTIDELPAKGVMGHDDVEVFYLG